MAERRMFAKTIIDSDPFIDMPLSTQALYFHLSMRADDEGFINNPKKIQRMIGASEDDLKVLMAKRFLLPFESGVVVIKHWKIHNYIRNDRFKPTVYTEEKAMLAVKENGVYTERETLGIPDGYHLDTQDRLGKDSIELELGKGSIEDDKPPKVTRHQYGLYKNVLLTDEDYSKVQDEFPHDYSERIDRLSEYIASTGKSYKNHLATIRAWARKDSGKTASQSQSSNPFLDMLRNGE
jgi:hypothetical protein